MKLTLIGHDDRYAVEQLQMALFPEGTEGEAISTLHRGAVWLTATAKITIDGKTSLLAARCSVEVKSEFVIENRVLTAYKGWGGDVVIPDDEGIMYIGPFAFSLYTLDFEVEIPEDDHRFGGCYGIGHVHSAVFPAIQK